MSFAKLNVSNGDSLFIYKMNATSCESVTHMSYDSQTQQLFSVIYHTSERYIVMFNITSLEFTTLTYSTLYTIYVIFRYDNELFSLLGYKAIDNNH